MSEYAIKVNQLTKSYNLYQSKVDRLKEIVHPFKKTFHNQFFALNNISFSVSKGETVGVLGKNGSGKSTLLKIIAGVLQPSFGDVEVNGSVSALLELGAGFNPEYTGMENIYLYGTIVGLSKKEISEKVNSIVTFADIGEFINQPVKMYSSGMFARLAFAVAINVDPDILIVDEALSVGDAYFQEKSFTKMKEFRKQGKSIFFVSHSISGVRNFCDRAIWIDKGELVLDGVADVVCTEYQDFINEQNQAHHQQIAQESDNSQNKIYIRDVKMDKAVYQMDEDIQIKINLEFREEILSYGVGVIVYDASGRLVTLYNTVRDDIVFSSTYNELILRIPRNDFIRGKYFLTVVISDELSMFPYDRKDFITTFAIEYKKNRNGIPIGDGMFRSKHEWIY